ncbi:hydrolase [Actinoplanes italicus]|uniref:Pimeloyl-ACP methyl ester carboxylesterase n=1 Tax=Actinoplanes italicus TaxID=113567 RepID=A0A2T0JA23_9ACTN|nr:alpha/beta fold hydrolase [Actinoplanes italicus]PRX04381.1 pimeloyl-ACP methyl ester carboxylesterase [Actinoplanes italicus]GIE37005.1 hydrolase [Actinoplanes italicus]
MAFAFTNGIRLGYERRGSGEPVLLIMGSGAGGRAWTLYQTPALVRAGFQAVTFDNRGIPPSDAPPGRYSLAEMVADTRGLIEALGVGPCHIIGQSMGALIAQELAISAPHLVRSAVLMATKARTDTTRTWYGKAYRNLADSDHKLPADFAAMMTAFLMLSPATLDDEESAGLWLESFEQAESTRRASVGQEWADIEQDRRPALRAITAPCRVIAFADDLVTPPKLCAEVAEAIPDCDLVRIEKAGHFGYLERPDEVNAAILEFLRRTG